MGFHVMLITSKRLFACPHLKTLVNGQTWTRTARSDPARVLLTAAPRSFKPPSPARSLRTASLSCSPNTVVHPQGGKKVRTCQLRTARLIDLNVFPVFRHKAKSKHPVPSNISFHLSLFFSPASASLLITSLTFSIHSLLGFPPSATRGARISNTTKPCRILHPAPTFPSWDF